MILKTGKNNQGINAGSRGFTLIELLVALFVFGLAILSIVGIFTSALKSQRKAISIQSAQESGRYLLETMTKEIRVSTINTGSASGVNTINITNPRLETFDYVFDAANKRVLKNGQTASPDNAEISGVFYIETANYPSRAKVTIIMEIRPKAARPEEGTTIKLQSTVACRGH